MSKKVNQILEQALDSVRPSKEDLDLINNSLKDFLKNLEKEIKKNNVLAEPFVGGSFAKQTMIKKNKYDVDIFLRFDKKYSDEEISLKAKKLLKNFKGASIVHGSRDYFNINIAPGFFIELIPVLKVNNPKESKNITDLSCSHVKYIRKKVKNKKLLDEIRLAKAFCYANNCYGAESYIKGFSGYSLELLIYHYGSFLKFIKEISKQKGKLVIDIEKHFKNKNHVLMDINSSKLQSPIILVDPTYKQRNTMAALSEETLKKFQKACVKFLKNPSIKSFELEKKDLEKIKKQAIKSKSQFILLEAQTNKQEGDVAGSKLLKFYNHLFEEISKVFDLKNKGFNYNQKKSARYFFVVKPKKEIILQGPFIDDKKNVERFKKQHKKVFKKGKHIYCKEKPVQDLKNFIELWKKKNKRKIREMWITGLKVV